MRRHVAVLALLVLTSASHTPQSSAGTPPGTDPAASDTRRTTLLPDGQLDAIVAEANGLRAKDTVTALASMHRVQASAGFHEAAEFVAARARAYGLADVAIEQFPADGTTTYGT